MLQNGTFGINAVWTKFKIYRDMLKYNSALSEYALNGLMTSVPKLFPTSWFIISKCASNRILQGWLLIRSPSSRSQQDFLHGFFD